MLENNTIWIAELLFQIGFEYTTWKEILIFCLVLNPVEYKHLTKH